jgi:hypothetical protein
MPRVYNGQSDPIDFCKKCFPPEDVAREVYGEGEGPDDRGNCFDYESDHPSYNECDYKCAICRKPLTEKDD